MNIQKIPIDKLNPAKYNPRKDLSPDDPEYQKILKSIELFDYIEPIVWNQNTGNIISGHQRFKILKQKRYKEVDVSIVNLSQKKEKQLNIALNKIRGEWEFDKLREILKELDSTDFTGWDDDEIVTLLKTQEDINLDDIDFASDTKSTITITFFRKDKNIIISELQEMTKKHEGFGYYL